MRKMVHVVIELTCDTIEDEAEQTKPEDSDEELSLRLRETCFMRNQENMTARGGEGGRTWVGDGSGNEESLQEERGGRVRVRYY